MVRPGVSVEVRQFCERVLGSRELAQELAEAAAATGVRQRLQLLTFAVRQCRARADDLPAAPDPIEVSSPDGGTPGPLAQAVARELAVANAALPERQREALVLRELLRLNYAQIGTVAGLEPSAVAALLARSRLSLRAELRGADPDPPDGCFDRGRALGLLARRQDSERLEPGDDEWLRAHMARCAQCERAHAAMLEASVCYRAWSS